MACPCKKRGGHMAPAPKPKDLSKESVKPQEKEDKKDETK